MQGSQGMPYVGVGPGRAEVQNVQKSMERK
jgi:hypothetical protein